MTVSSVDLFGLCENCSGSTESARGDVMKILSNSTKYVMLEPCYLDSTLSLFCFLPLLIAVWSVYLDFLYSFKDYRVVCLFSFGSDFPVNPGYLIWECLHSKSSGYH